MDQRLKDAGFRFAFSPIRVKFRPTAKDLQLCEESGRELALAIKRKLKAKEASVSSLGEDSDRFCQYMPFWVSALPSSQGYQPAHRKGTCLTH